MSNFINVRYNNVDEIKDYRIWLSFANKELNVPIADDFLIYRILNSLPIV